MITIAWQLLFYTNSAFGFPEHFVVNGDSIDDIDTIMERATGASSDKATSVYVWERDSSGQLIPLDERRPRIDPPPDKDASIGVDIEGDGDGFLRGKAVYLSQCHGWIYYESLNRFGTQRGNNYDTVEDFHNPEGANQYLIHYLENAGAQVFTTKERGMNSNMAISDNDGDGYSEAGTGFEDGPLGFEDLGEWEYGVNPFDEGTTRRFLSDSGSVASWIPDVPESGFYTIYVSWDSDSENTTSAHYRITHNGGVIDRYFNQTVHGSTWQYVEQLWLDKGVDSLKIELIADNEESGKYLSADAVRVGGGMGDVIRQGETSGRPRWEEGAIQYIQFNGAPTSVYDPYNDGDGSDPSSRSRWAKWEHPSGEDAVYLSWHSNASSEGNARGTSTYIYSPDWGQNTGFVAGSDTFAQYVQDELIDVFQSEWEADWSDRGVRSANFSEVNPSHNNEMPSALVELAFHDNEIDSSYLKEPLFRRDSARAMYRGIVRYFANKDGKTPLFAPEVPTGLQTTHQDNMIVISWNAPSTDYGDAADSYLLFLSDDGKSWANGIAVQGTSYEIQSTSYQTKYVRVAAVNEGGASFPSNTLAFSRSPDGLPPALIVDAFDRLQASTLYEESVPYLGSLRRMNLRSINSYQSAVPHARALGAMGWGFDSVSDEVFTDLDISSYQVVIWVAGEESTLDDSIDSASQAILENYWRGGGKLFITGAEILWDLDYRGDASDKAFAQSVLGATMESDDAEVEAATGKDILAGLDIDFSFAAGRVYHVEYPDVLSTSRTSVLQYTSDGIAASIGEGVFFMGFPFETISSLETQDEVMKRVMEELLSYTPPIAAEPTSDPEEESSDELYTFDKEPLDGPKGCMSVHTVPQSILILMGMLVYRRRNGR